MISVCSQMPLHQIRCKLELLVEYHSLQLWKSNVLYLWKYYRELVNTVERNAASLNKDQIITAENHILPRAQADVGAFDYKLKSFKKRLNRYFFIQMTNIRHYPLLFRSCQ